MQPEPIRQLRDLTRYRAILAAERTREAQRLEKELEDAGIKLSSVATDILGVSGRAMLTALIEGERDVHTLEACPYGCGHHPYLSPGSGLIDQAVLNFTAGTRIVTDPDRQLPTGTEPVAGSCFDFSAPRQLGDQRIDFAFTDLACDNTGRAWVRLDGPDGRRAELWVDDTYSLIELYTGDTLSPHRRRQGLGVKPMTCPPNAFQSGDGVHRIEPGQTVTTRWGTRLR